MEYYTIMICAMILNSLILTGFLLLMISDLLWTKGLGPASAVRMSGYMIIGCAFGLFVLAPDPSWPLPIRTGLAERMAGWRPGSALAAIFMVLAAVSSILLFWSVFLEIGIIRKKLGLVSSDIVSSGTYGLCRHPGFWWLTFLVLAIGALKGLNAYFAPVSMTIFLDLLLILFQDRYTFPKVFPRYDDYKESVPFLLPGRRPGRLTRNQGK